MNYAFFDQFFAYVDTPVVVYQKDSTMAVYQNRQAKLLLNPLDYNPHQNIMTEMIPLNTIFSYQEQTAADFRKILATNGYVSDFLATLQKTSGEHIKVTISASQLVLDETCYVILYIKPSALPSEERTHTSDETLANVLHLSHIAENTDDAINQILAFAGSYPRVSRSYIFESISSEHTANTYEWCAPGVEPVIAMLQCLPKDAYSYDYIVSNGLAISEDIRQMPECDRAVLEPQGIKSLATIPIMYRGEPLGYVGFDDCENYRKWSQSDIQLLCDIADMLATLLARRNAERSLRYSLNVLQTVTDNSDNLVFVNDIETHKVLFTNNTVAELVGVPKEKIVGTDCQEILGNSAKGITHSCNDCPLPLFIDEDGHWKQTSRTWEVRNPHNGKWYLTRGAIIKWIDGNDVYIETATDITRQKEYEVQLQHFAITDTMTGIYNRVGGRTMILHLLESQTAPAALAFIDLDGLKKVNDSLGHELGDEMICRTVDLIKSALREQDIFCRWGGDEFLIFFSCGKEHADMIMTQILNSLDAFNATGKAPYQIRFSYGTVAIPVNTNQSLENLVAAADALMYEDKAKHYSMK